MSGIPQPSAAARKRAPYVWGAFVALFVAVNVLLVLLGDLSLGWDGLGTMLGAGVTLAILSFLYDDNPLFKAVEHLYVGVAAGYTLCITWYNVIYPDLVRPIIVENLLDRGDGFAWGNFIKLAPLALGVAMLLRLSRRWGWLSRLSFAFVIGFYSGVTIPSYIDAILLTHVGYSVASLWAPGIGFWGVVNRVVVLVGVLSVLVYFFFSIEHKGPLGRAVAGIGRVGVYFLMVSFGASFGYTIMARMTLFVDRVDFLLRDWLHLIGGG